VRAVLLTARRYAPWVLAVFLALFAVRLAIVWQVLADFCKMPGREYELEIAMTRLAHPRDRDGVDAPLGRGGGVCSRACSTRASSIQKMIARSSTK